MASFDTFMALRDFVKGKISKYELEDSDPNIYGVREDKTSLGQSIIRIEFKTDDQFWKAVDLHEDDVWFMRMIFSYYSDYEFMDSYSIDDDFRNGYIIFQELNEDNIEKLKRISRYIFGKKFDLESEDFKSELAEKLLITFKKQTEDIVSEYQSEKNNEMRQVAQIRVKKDLNDYFNEFGLTYVPDDVLTTTVANLMMWYIRTNSLHLPIEKVLPEIFKTNKSSLGGWEENYYEFQDSEYFDETSFNNYTSRKLDEIIEKIEDGADDDFNARDYVDMVDRISKKIEIGRWYDLPKNKKVRFKIENFEMNPNKIVVKLSKDLKQRTLKLSEENFYHLLYQPTLFNLEEI